VIFVSSWWILLFLYHEPFFLRRLVSVSREDYIPASINVPPYGQIRIMRASAYVY